MTETTKRHLVIWKHWLYKMVIWKHCIRGKSCYGLLYTCLNVCFYNPSLNDGFENEGEFLIGTAHD